MNDNTQHDVIPSLADLMADDDGKSGRHVIQAIAALLIAVGLLFTGALNYMLYSRPFPVEFKVFGVIPALLIEGSLATFMLGSFVWFSHGAQGIYARIFGWAMFGIVALNTIVEFNALAGGTGGNELVALYAFWGVPVVIPLVVGFWKCVIDADPQITIMRQRRKMRQALAIGEMAATMHALGSEVSRESLAIRGEHNADVINSKLRGAVPVERNGYEAPNAAGQRPS